MNDEALFGSWLQRRRKSMNLTQEALGALLGCSSATVRKIEAEERRPSERVARLLADHLEVPTDEREFFLKFARGGWSDAPPSTTVGPPVPFPWQHTPKLPDSIPSTLTPLLGREQEAQSAVDIFRSPGSRLVTLTGPGGTGKTRLAFEIAHRLRQEYRHGVHCALLAPLQDPQHLPSAVARTFGVKESGSYPLWAQAKDHLGDKELLLLLDNFEQIIAAGPLVAELLECCPRVRVLVTSREVLRLPGEQEFPVPPLDVPYVEGITACDPVEIVSYPAVELFLRRAKEARPDFQLTPENSLSVANLCSRLDGLPLAIELAAARIRLLSPEAMLNRLSRNLDLLAGGARNAPERQKTMRQAIAWSYDLLDEDERKLLRRVSVFSGGFSLEAVEAVAQPERSLLDTLTSLVEKSLVRSGTEREPRFSLLETIREYGIDKLAEHGEEAEGRRRHANFFVDLMEGVEDELRGPEQARWMKFVDHEHSNIRAALSWCLDFGAPDTALRLAGASWWYWYVQGHFTEGREFLAAALKKSMSDDSPWHCRALIGAARLAVRQNDDDEAEGLFAEAERLSQALGDQIALARSLQGRARVATRRGNFSRARDHAEEALAKSRDTRQERDEALCLNELGEIARSEGQYGRAGDYYERSLTILRTIGDKVPMVSLLANLGYVSQRRDDLIGSASRFEEGLRLAREVGDRVGIATTLAGMAGVASLSGAGRRAAILFGAAEAVYGAGGMKPDPVDQAEMDLNVEHARKYVPPEEWRSIYEIGRNTNLDEAIETALAISRESQQ